MFTTTCFKRFCRLLIALMIIMGGTPADADTLHGTTGETQAVSEMKARLRTALKKGDLNACKREADNLARYGQSAQGASLIRQDVDAIQRQLDAIRLIYKAYYDLRTYTNKKSVKQAFKLIEDIKNKFTEDAVTNVSMVFLPSPLTTPGMIAGEFYKSAQDLYGNYRDARELRDSATSLKELDQLVKAYDQRIKSLQPAIKSAQEVRARLLVCQKAFADGAAIKHLPQTAPIPSVKADQPGRVTATFAFFGTWDKGYTNEARGRVFRPRYWYDLGWERLDGPITADGFKVMRHRPYRSRQGQVMPEFFSHEEAVGRIVGNTLVELRYTLHRKEPEEEEKAEIILKDIPFEPDASRGQGRVFRLSAAHPVTGAVDSSFPDHIVKLEHQITFFDNGKQTVSRLQSANWSYSEPGIGGFRQIPWVNIMLSR